MEEASFQTFTGRRFYYARPTADMICIEDIAHHLSIEARFCGATRSPYAVGQHSVWVSHVIRLLQIRDGINPATREAVAERLQGLLHDGSEAYTKDIPKPLKSLLGDVYANIANPIQNLIYQCFGLSLIEAPRVKEADDLALFTESRDLLVMLPFWWEDKAFRDPITPLSARKTELLFLKEFRKLTRQLKGPTYSQS
jgi:hypothetical protein